MTPVGNSERLRVLLVEDNPGDVDLMREHVRDVAGTPPSLEVVGTLAEALRHLGSSAFDVVLLDLGLPDSEGLETLDRTLAEHPELPVTVLTGLRDEELGTEALRRGAVDFVPKEDLSAAILGRTIRFAVERKRMTERLRRSRDRLRAAQTRLELLRTVAVTANRSRDLDEALRSLVSTIPEMLGWDLGHAFEVDRDRLRSLPFWYPERTDRFAAFREATERLAFENEELVSSARDTGRVEYVADLAETEVFLRRNAAVELQRALIIPVTVAGDVVAVLELFSTEEDTAADAVLNLAEEIATQLGPLAERERTVRRLRESRNLLRELVEGVPDAMYVKDAGGRYVLINESGAELIGRSAEEVVGKTEPELFERESAERIVRVDRRVVEERRTISHEEEVTDLHGTTRTYLVTKGPLRAADGTITGLFGISRDVTELARTQAALQERVKELRTLYRTTRELARADVPLGDRLAEVVRLIPPGWLHPEATEARIRWGDEVFETEGFRESPWMLSADIVSRDVTVGSIDVALTEECPQADTGPFLAEEEELLHAMALAISETLDQERLEREFARAQRMEAVGQLSGGIAHDFNNLLTVIRAHADFALSDPASAPLVEELRAVQEAADRAAQLTNQLLAFSKEQVLRPRNVDPNEAVRRTMRLVSRILGEDIRIEEELAPEPPDIFVDPHQLEQALLNLAVNARDAMPSGGTLTLATAVEADDPDPSAVDGENGRFVRITVSDTGVGMDDDVRSRAFEPFFTTKGRERGTGLGLAMVYGFVTQSQGTIEVESAPEEGTTFTLRFPSARADGKAVSAATPPKGTGEPLTGRVLLIEDDPSVRRVARKMLERADFDVVDVPRAELALELLREADHGFDVVLTDLVLPGMSGRELLDRIRELPPEIPLVAMSGYPEGRPGQPGELDPDIFFIQKPFTPTSLAEVLREALAAART